MPKIISRSWACVVLCVLAGLIVFIGAYWQRPLFYEYDDLRLRLPNWRQLRPMTDRFGNYGYVDRHYNMLVLVCAGADAPPLNPYAECYRGRAILLKGTDFEASVTASYDTIIVVRDGKSTSSPISPGFASSVYAQCRYIDSHKELNLEDEILRQLANRRVEPIRTGEK